MTLPRAATLPPTKKSDPRRTCIGCRTTTTSAALVRVRLRDGELTTDPRAGGRGAWLCRADPVACLDAAARRRALDRALRVRVDPDVVAALRTRLGTPTPEDA